MPPQTQRLSRHAATIVCLAAASATAKPPSGGTSAGLASNARRGVCPSFALKDKEVFALRATLFHVKGSATQGLLAILAALPWCCILPAVLSLLSIGGAAAARLWVGRLTWGLLPISVVLLGRAFWLIYVRRQGAPWSRWVTWGCAALVVVLWVPRLWWWLASGGTFS